jgi:DNA-binding beta-propeller fold protein YncE
MVTDVRRGYLAAALAAATACGGNTASPRPAAPLVAPPPEPAAPAVASGAPAPAPVAPGPLPDAGAPRGPVRLTAMLLALPGASGPAFLDYIACDRAAARVWVPVGSTGSVDVLDTVRGTFARVDSFRTEEREHRGKKRRFGPSAVSVGEGFVYVGNRASSEICPVDVLTLKVGVCIKLPAATDGVAYVASTREVWVTTPRAQGLAVLDASTPSALKLKTTVKTEGEPEGYAVDEERGLFFTNLEDKGTTLAIDLRTHKVKAAWHPGCGPDGPRGLAFDGPHDFVIVACTDHVQVLDAAHDGAPLGRLDTGGGLDNIDFVDGKLYAASGKAARLTVAAVDDRGQLAVVATGETSEGARNAVADASGNAYVADSLGARILVLSPAPLGPAR